MSFEPDLAWRIENELRHLASVTRIAGGVRVMTHCLYPSNSLVQVVVRGGPNTIIVSDDGGASGDALSAGIPVKDYARTLSHLVTEQGLFIKGGVVFSPQLPTAAAPAAILHVANASQEVARWLYDHLKIPRTRDFRVALAEFLRTKFVDRLIQNETIVGHSQKPHRFANIIELLLGRRLIVDPVSHDASSINSRVIANLDVKANNNPLIEQRIVYDDDEAWTAADLNLLQVGAYAIPFSRSTEVIGRLALGG
jgi:hypothetical protein